MSSHLKGPSDGEWSVFAEKVTEERDAAREQASAMRAMVERLLPMATAFSTISREAEDFETCVRAFELLKAKP